MALRPVNSLTSKKGSSFTSIRDAAFPGKWYVACILARAVVTWNRDCRGRLRYLFVPRQSS